MWLEHDSKTGIDSIREMPDEDDQEPRPLRP